MGKPLERFEKRYVLDGKGSRLKFIFADVIFLVGYFALFRYSFFDFGNEVIDTKPFLYWGLLSGATFALYMATTRISLRRMAVAVQATKIIGEYMEGTYEEIAEFSLDLQKRGSKVLEKAKGTTQKTLFRYEVDENGDEVLTVER